jgi:hypothetical protein
LIDGRGIIKLARIAFVLLQVGLYGTGAAFASALPLSLVGRVKKPEGFK